MSEDSQLPDSELPSSDADSRPLALVIGTGFGGLAAACRLLARGYRVTLLEKRDQPGGRAYVYRQDGFVFDGGPTVITAPFLLEELWQLFGRDMHDDVDMREVFPYYRIRFHDGAVFDYQGTAEGMAAEVAKFNPADVEGYARFVEESRRIFEVGFEDLSFVPFPSFTDMIRIAPDMVKLQSYRSVYGLVSRYVKDERLRQVFSFHPLLVGGNPYATTSIYSLIAFLERKWGVWFPMGGTGALIQGLVRLIQDQGGQLRLNCPVEEILVEQGRAAGVRLEGGEELRSDIVVSNADAAWTYRHLVRPEHRKRWTDRKVEGSRFSMGLFVWYFGTDRQYPDVAHHTILLGPRYKGLLDDIFEKKILAQDFSLYLHRPTATDPSLAPPGCDAFYVLSPVPHLDADIDWDQQRAEYRDRILRYLAATVMPDLDQHVVTEHILDPIGFRDELLSLKGSAFSFEPVLTQSAWFRPHNKSEDIEDLYIVGAGTHPGAGVPGVLSSAKVLDRVVPDPATRRARSPGGR